MVYGFFLQNGISIIKSLIILFRKKKTESAPPPQQPAPQIVQQPAAVVQQPAPTPMKVDIPAKIGDISLSEDDLMKLKKINFKKKVTGKSCYKSLYPLVNY